MRFVLFVFLLFQTLGFAVTPARPCGEAKECFHTCPNGVRESHCDESCQSIPSAWCLGKTNCGCPQQNSLQLDLCIRAGGTYDKDKCSPKSGPYKFTVNLFYRLNEESAHLLEQYKDTDLKGVVRQIAILPNLIHKNPQAICPLSKAPNHGQIILYKDIAYLVRAQGGEFASASVFPDCGIDYVGRILVRPIEGYFKGNSGQCYSVSSLSTQFNVSPGTPGLFTGVVPLNIKKSSSSNCP